MTQNTVFQNVLFKYEVTCKGAPYKTAKCYVIPGKSYIFHISYPISVNNVTFIWNYVRFTRSMQYIFGVIKNLLNN